MKSACIVCDCFQLEVEFSPAYDRQPHPDIELEKYIEKVFVCFMIILTVVWHM